MQFCYNARKNATGYEAERTHFTTWRKGFTVKMFTHFYILYSCMHCKCSSGTMILDITKCNVSHYTIVTIMMSQTEVSSEYIQPGGYWLHSTEHTAMHCTGIVVLITQ